MLKIYDVITRKQIPFNISDEDWYITHKYDGYDTLTIEISDQHEMYSHIAEEIKIADDTNRYIIKNVDEHSGLVSIDCEIDLDDWKSQFWQTFRMTDSTLQQVLDAIKPIGWYITGSLPPKRATIESSEGQPLNLVTAADVLSKASETYSVVFNFDVLNKKIKVINPNSYTSSGEYITEELNLRSIGFVGNTKEFATRLYAYGKKDESGNAVTFASINNGKDYIEDFSYSSKIISVGWSDERYTIPENLLEDAKKKLASMAYPVRSYECDVISLDMKIYLYKIVTLIDRKRKTRVEHRVIEFTEYPKAHHKDVVMLSAVPPKIEGSIKSIRAEIKEQVNTNQKVASDAVIDAMETIIGNKGGHVSIKMISGLPEEIQVTHNDNTTTVLNAAGVKRGSRQYHYLMASGEVSGTTSIQLSSEFRGRDVAVTLQLKSLEPSGANDVLQLLKTDYNFDKPTGMLRIIVDCKMYDVVRQAQASPKSIKVAYTIIA